MDKILCPSKGKHFCFSIARVKFTSSNKRWFHETINSWRSPPHDTDVCYVTIFRESSHPDYNCTAITVTYFSTQATWFYMNWLRTTAETPFHRTLLWLCFVSFTFFVWSDAPELVLPQSFNGSLRRCFEQMGFYYSLCFACYLHIIIIPI